MIQRVQTLYLLAAAVLLSLMFFMPMATVSSSDGELVVKAFAAGEGAQESLSAVAGTKYLSVVLVVALAISLLTIFKYKNRIFQIKMCLANIGVLIGLQIYTAYSIYKASSFIEKMNEAVPNYSPGVNYSVVDIFPLIAIVVTFLAYRGIIKDEALVKSLDRLR